MDSARGAKRGREKRQGKDKDVQLSKAMSYALRHGAQQLGLQMGTDGFLFVEDLLAHPQFHSYTLEDVERVVATNDKQRFKLRSHPDNGRLEIRANQGHSIQVSDLELIPLLAGSPACPVEAVHGTYLRNWPSIQQHGLSRMNRTHIHLAPGLPGEDGVISGMRKNCDLAVFIDVPMALADGIEFFRSENGVLLTAGNTEGKLLPKYFIRALRLRPTRSVLPLQ
ncbi:tRNA 2'-phosphotransferase 1 isoform X2 [Oryzias melastigma]|uniref:tRNA 2'-phosphotransferase 1 isoform X2 n=1 Tax=Oryzias melastigma TaxID=30732 RepID=UPI000CF818D1|nr:tRNA 2'-phosphotransferase 1 isoform X2 [Oryzias melastigma]